MADFFFTSEAFVERDDFIRRQGGADNSMARDAVARVDGYARDIAQLAQTNLVTLEAYTSAEMRWAEDQYNLMVASIRSGQARFAHAGVSLDADGNIILTAQAIEDLADPREK